MSFDEIPERPMPVWVKLVIIVCVLPLLAFPQLMALCPPHSSAELMLWIYPFYVLLSAVLEWRCWGRRPEPTWVLLAVELLSHGAMWILVDPSILLP